MLFSIHRHTSAKQNSGTKIQLASKLSPKCQKQEKNVKFYKMNSRECSDMFITKKFHVELGDINGNTLEVKKKSTESQ